MLIYIILFLTGCILGISFIITGIIFRNRMQPSIMISMIFFGIFITIGCKTMALACSAAVLPLAK